MNQSRLYRIDKVLSSLVFVTVMMVLVALFVDLNRPQTSNNASEAKIATRAFLSNLSWVCVILGGFCLASGILRAFIQPPGWTRVSLLIVAGVISLVVSLWIKLPIL